MRRISCFLRTRGEGLALAYFFRVRCLYLREWAQPMNSATIFMRSSAEAWVRCFERRYSSVVTCFFW